MFPCALCNDSDIQDGAVVGDPTEGALYVLAAEGRRGRQGIPREQPADRVGAVRLRLQVHGHLPHDAGRRRQARVRAYVKGAPDVVLERSASARMPGGRAERAHRRDAGEGAGRERAHRQPGPARAGSPSAGVRPGDVRPVRRPDGADAGPGDARRWSARSTRRAPRRWAIAKAKRAGIRVRMITGDHAVTAAAIADELGIEGRAVTGAEFAALTDDEAAEPGRRDRRDRPGGARAQGQAGRGAQAQGQRRRDDRRRRQRRAGDRRGRHRHRHGHHRHRRRQGRGQDDPGRRQLRHHRGRRRARARRSTTTCRSSSGSRWARWAASS